MAFRNVKYIAISFPVSILWDFEVKKNTKTRPMRETHNLTGFDRE